jgi:hypothetical protein
MPAVQAPAILVARNRRGLFFNPGLSFRIMLPERVVRFRYSYLVMANLI